MAVNEEGRQTEIANELAEVARTLAHSTRTVPHPSDSYELLGALADAQAALGQVYAQLDAWHSAAVDGRHYDGEDGRGIPGQPAAGATGTASVSLRAATVKAMATANLLLKAHNANGVVRWFDDVKEMA
ncbi:MULTISPECIES: hypothetical protein [Cryobacterium]|uniref:hypothetical protein n=1 Tax=Cryobacterium TaxID=69578 RepID=UPI000CD499D5|nr:MULTISPECIES: hypothetical protein [Cryobacterium]POH67790.1 hypothetical protein C3B60_06100 [Cryobacterium zongtaii]TFC47791.1 hypothetical protein E3O57_02300 [Cryobacterium sp. TMN-39-2]